MGKNKSVFERLFPSKNIKIEKELLPWNLIKNECMTHQSTFTHEQHTNRGID